MGDVRLMLGSGVGVGAPGINVRGPPGFLVIVWVYVPHALTNMPTRMIPLRNARREVDRIGFSNPYTGRMLQISVRLPSRDPRTMRVQARPRSLALLGSLAIGSTVEV